MTECGAWVLGEWGFLGMLFLVLVVGIPGCMIVGALVVDWLDHLGDLRGEQAMLGSIDDWRFPGESEGNSGVEVIDPIDKSVD